MQQKKPFIKHVPNILSTIRLLMVPLFIYAFFNPGWVLPDYYFGMLIFIVASITDWIDGYIARKYDAISNYGKLADPIADKALTISALWLLARGGMISYLFLFLVVAKETLMIIGGYVMLRHHIVVYSQIWGKVAMFLFVTGITLSFIPGVQPYNSIILYMALTLTIVSLFLYAKGAIDQLRAQGEQEAAQEEIQ